MLLARISCEHGFAYGSQNLKLKGIKKSGNGFLKLPDDKKKGQEVISIHN
jgi:hypothetical protein